MIAFKELTVTTPSTIMKRLILILCVSVIVGCAESSGINPLPSEAVIVAFGDSLTSGVGATDGNTYPDVLSHLSGFTVINAGVSGETTESGSKRLPVVLKEHEPDLVILIQGGNDILRNRSPIEIKADLETMIVTAQRSSIPVVLAGIPEKSLFSSSAPYYEELADRYELVYEGKIIGRLMRDSGMKSDPIHFNDAGYRVLAESIYNLLRDSGAL